MKDGFFNNKKGLRIYYRQWIPTTETKAILFVVHGIAEHSGRYQTLVDYFVAKGYQVETLDHEGHGKSEGHPLYVADFEDYLDPIKQRIDSLQQTFPQLPIYMVGHSMGGLISSHFFLQYSQLLAGGILSGPAVTIPKEVSKLSIFFAKWLARLCPKIGVSRLDARGVSRDPAVVAAYKADPLIRRGRITAGLGMALLQAMEYLVQHASHIALPLLIMNGGDDPIVNPEDSALLYKIVGSKDKTYQCFPGLYHEIFNEPEHLEVFKFMENHLESRL